MLSTPHEKVIRDIIAVMAGIRHHTLNLIQRFRD
jgi:hypothetical protein